MYAHRLLDRKVITVLQQLVASELILNLFANPESCFRLVGALLSDQLEDWLSGKLYLALILENTPTESVQNQRLSNHLHATK